MLLSIHSTRSCTNWYLRPKPIDVWKHQLDRISNQYSEIYCASRDDAGTNKKPRSGFGFCNRFDDVLTHDFHIRTYNIRRIYKKLVDCNVHPTVITVPYGTCRTPHGTLRSHSPFSTVQFVPFYKCFETCYHHRHNAKRQSCVCFCFISIVLLFGLMDRPLTK